MKGTAFRGRCLIDGTAKGEILVSKVAFTFAHGVDPSTGRVSDVHSDIQGANVKDKILVYPYGKGLTTASSWFLETVRAGNAPAAILTEATDLSAVTGSVIARQVYGKSIPVLSSFPEEFYSKVRSGTLATVRGDEVEVLLEA